MINKSKITLNKLVRNFLSLTIANIFGQIMMFISTVYIARYFGPNNFGIINFSSVIVMYFTAIASFGLQTLGILEISKKDKNNNMKINTILSLRLILAIISYILLIILVIFLNKDIVYKLNILLYGLTVFPAAVYVDWIFNANQEMQYNSRSIIIKSLTYSLLVIVALTVFKLKNLYYIALYMFIATLISSGYLLYMLKEKYKYKFIFIFNIKEYKYLICNGWPFFFSGIFATINSTIGTLMLGFIRSDYEIGLYNSVYKIVTVFIMIAGLLFTPVYPLLINYYNNEKYEHLSSLINNLRKFMYIISIPMIFAAFILNKEIINTLYGDKYRNAYNVLTILIIYVAVLYIREIYGYALNAWNLQKKYMNIVLISSIYNIISNLLFIKIWGIEGAAMNSLISELINLILMHRASTKAVKLSYEYFSVHTIVFSSIVMSLFICIFKYLTVNGVLLAAIGGIVYIVTLFLTKTITISEVKSNLIVKER